MSAPHILVFGVGGAGGNAVNNMIDASLPGVEFVAANTDAQQLSLSKAERRIQLGAHVTQGLGAGAQPQIGAIAAEESLAEVAEHLDGAHMLFITAGMGGGTGTGAAPVIAQCARERGILTVGVVTKPFGFEGRRRMQMAEAGIEALERFCDTLIVVPNQNLFRVATAQTTFTEAFRMADEVLHAGVRSVTDLIVLPGLINLDFADVLAVMSGMGPAMMGAGEASGDDRARMAAERAIENPLLDITALHGARAVLVNVTGGADLSLLEVDEAANTIAAQVDADANIIFGAALHPSMEGRMRVSVIATGMGRRGPARTEPPRGARPGAAEPPATAQIPEPESEPEPERSRADTDPPQAEPVGPPTWELEPPPELEMPEPPPSRPSEPERTAPASSAYEESEPTQPELPSILTQRPRGPAPRHDWLSRLRGR